MKKLSLRAWLRPCSAGVALVLAGYVAAAVDETPESALRLRERGPQPLIMAGQDHAVTPQPDAARQPNPLAAVIDGAKAALRTAPVDDVVASGIGKESYLDLVDGVVEHFRHFQSAGGRIIDPYLHRESQYSTPTYALAAATLVGSGKRPELLDSAARALTSSLYQLASGTTAQRTGDFFILPTMLAYRQLRDRVDTATKNRWDRYLRLIKPEIAYADLIGAGQNDVMNWNSAAIAGEYLRHKEGFTGEDFVARYLSAQLPRFTPQGLYRDPDLPLIYDAEARFNFSVLLAAGYQGEWRQSLDILLTRGAWASLLMQAPTGDFPAGGRSADHIWNDALNCASFEFWANRSKAAGDGVAAGAFKRAARLAAGAASRWVRPSGEFQLVKNYFDPALRHGYEDYSADSHYNLLAAAYLSIAWSLADESIPEGVSPADIGGFVLHLPDFHKVFANAAGNYIAIDTAADARYDSTGILRLSRRDDKNPPGSAINAPANDFPLAIGVAWPSAGGWQSLAQFAGDRVGAQVAVTAAQPAAVGFNVTYRLKDAAVDGVSENYLLTKDALSVAININGPIDSWKIRYPAFVTDGKNLAQRRTRGASLVTHIGDRRETFAIIAPEKTTLTGSGRFIRADGGYSELFEAAGSGRTLTYRLSSTTGEKNEKQ
ncbi:hypothetical protein [Brenneria tiliae]|uniref:Alginate lyase domain-containing protein n=1 Tax=Brenneria tiliae TaxID=2914984 RepID=A0ABT0MY35_9GAMM|nr:hypothetical protein [Brenneria tiliae]MCL2894755.1 hypothetical protein [Brenneria tiliae]